MRERIKHFFKINWYRTILVNFRAFAWNDALRFPVVVYRGFKISEFTGEIKINVPVKFGIIGFGQPYEIFKKGAGAGEAVINGRMIVNGSVQFGLDSKLYVKKGAVLVLGHINSFASRSELICFQKIIIGNWVQFGNDCLITDSNFHPLKDIEHLRELDMNSDITIGHYNFIGARSTVKGKTVTPNHCISATNSLLNKDYSALGENCIIAGIPAKKIKHNIIRDWDSEKEQLEDYLSIKL